MCKDHDFVNINHENTNSVVLEILNCAKKVETDFDNCINQMNIATAPSNLKGSAGDTLVQEFTRFKSTFDRRIELIKMFANTIDEANVELKNLDQRRSKQANELHDISYNG